MKGNLLGQLESAKLELTRVKDRHGLLQLKSRYLGAKSQVAMGLSQLKGLEAGERAKAGQALNQVKKQLEKLFAAAEQELVTAQDFEPVDITEPGKREYPGYGHAHPTTSVIAESFRIFTELGFAIVDSPEVDTDWYNFEALNMPPEHPAREMQDTFYSTYQDKNGAKWLPRTHTSNMQVRFMEHNKPPFKIIVPGKVFRNENEDATHSWAFIQIEGVVVGEGVSMADLKGTLLRIVRGILGSEAEIRFRPSFFPYTEPSVELDCKYQGKWLELGGAGMIHPQVLRNGGIDPEKYTGFAFGWGYERLAVIKYGLNDLRSLWRPNFRYLEQF
ncbi:phenylalanine--tRNA ligase subunit alpha [Candidatus Saccharibacteria bacterium]|nr:phenylalanine--tRNA ligase subunit alpha [Candidatus Saccharibacteria bacterium]